MKDTDITRAKRLFDELDKLNSSRRAVAATEMLQLIVSGWASITLGDPPWLDITETDSEQQPTARARFAVRLKEMATLFYEEEAKRVRRELEELGVQFSEAA